MDHANLHEMKHRGPEAESLWPKPRVPRSTVLGKGTASGRRRQRDDRRVRALNEFALVATLGTGVEGVFEAAIDALREVFQANDIVGYYYRPAFECCRWMVAGTPRESCLRIGQAHFVREIALPDGVVVVRDEPESLAPLLDHLEQIRAALSGGPSDPQRPSSPRIVMPLRGPAAEFMGCLCFTLRGGADRAFELADPVGAELLRLAQTYVNAALVRSAMAEELESVFETLEERVSARTSELAHAQKDLQRTIEELTRTQAEMVEASRRAAMAEISSGVLHNVGNALNSVSVSASLMSEIVQSMRLDALGAVVDRLRKEDDLGGFLASSERAHALLRVLERIHVGAAEGMERAESELDDLRRSVEHLRAVVSAQQRIARPSGQTEVCAIDTVVHDALALANLGELAGAVECNEVSGAMISLERHRVVEILVNLLTNAADSVRAARRSDPCVAVRAGVVSGVLRIVVCDNGLGIDVAVRDDVFRYGFTTKPCGHGFGLHQSRRAAAELGGTLTFSSDGLDRGAEFTLEVPVEVLA